MKYPGQLNKQIYVISRKHPRSNDDSDNDLEPETKYIKNNTLNEKVIGPYEILYLCNRYKIIDNVACYLEQIWKLIPKTLPTNLLELTLFDLKLIPKNSISSYMRTIMKNSNISIEVLIMAIGIINKICTNNSESFDKLYTENGALLTLRGHNFHKIFAISIVLSAKFLDDNILNNEILASICGIKLSEFNLLEIEFLFIIKCDLFITYTTYSEIYHCIGNKEIHCNCSHSSMPEIEPEKLI
jgi:hypothetical protein